jgi:type IV pilus assembly protein PilF
MRLVRARTGAAAAVAVLCLVACGGEKKAPKTDPMTEAAGKVRLAESYLRASRYSDALQAMDQAIALQPQNAKYRNFSGQILFLAGRDSQAEQALRKALELDPYLSDAHNNLGALYDRLGRKDEAEKEFKLALEDPGYPTPEKAYLNLGMLYGSQGRDDEALRSMRRAVEMNPKYYQAHFQLASLLDRTGKLEEAAREYEVATPEYRGSGDFQYRLGFTYFRLKNYTKAREHLAKVLEMSPGSDNAVKANEILETIR